MSFDLLSDILRESGLQRRLLDLRRLADGDALRFPCERSIGLHVVTQGRLWLHAPALPEPLALGAGDVAFMARGCTHVLSTRAEPDAAAVASVTEIAAALPEGDAPGAGSAVNRVHSKASRMATATQANRRNARVWFMRGASAPAQAGDVGESEVGAGLPGAGGIVTAGRAANKARPRASRRSRSSRKAGFGWRAASWRAVMM